MVEEPAAGAIGPLGERTERLGVTALSTSIGSLTGRVTTRIDRLSDRRFALLAFLPGALLVALFVIPPIVAAIVITGFRIELHPEGATLRRIVRDIDDALTAFVGAPADSAATEA